MSLSPDNFKEFIGITFHTVMEFTSQREKDRAHTGRPYCLSSLTEVLLIMIYLRHYPVDLFLCVLFNASRQTIYNTRTRVLDWLYDTLKDRLTARSLQWRLDRSVEYLSQCFTFAIDGSEQPVLHSANSLIDTLFYSVKKKKHTVNIVVICSLADMKVLWMSPSFPGSFNDPQIVHKCNKWFGCLSSSEWGFGDSAFEGLTDYGIRVSAPPDRQSPLYSIYSKYRIKIENMFAALKNWGSVIFTLRIPPSNKDMLLDTHQKHWTIVAVLHNEYNG